MPADQHKISVVIPTVGRETLALCQAALAKQTRPPDEVLVILDRDRRGAAWARNEGIRQATGDLIALADDDGIPPPDWLERLVAALDRHSAAVAGGTFQETDPLLDAIRRRNPLPTDEQLDPGGLVGNTGNILFRRECLMGCEREDGYVFNPRFTGAGEDWELIWRLRKRGIKMVYVPNPVTHMRRATGRQHLRHAFQRGMSIAMLFRVIRADPAGIVPQDSLLWGVGGKKTKPQWVKALWLKLLGPFEWHAFRRKRHFWLFWLGEKCQAAGFCWEMCRGMCVTPENTNSKSMGQHVVSPGAERGS